MPEYNPDEIQVLDWRECVRKRPGMYIGDVETSGLTFLVQELINEATVCDAASSRIRVNLHEDGSCSVVDDGRPPAPETVRLGLQSLHGDRSNRCGQTTCHHWCLGYPVVSALSARFELDLWEGGQQRRQRSERGKRVGDLQSIEPAEPGPTSGVRIRFWPDRTIFEPEARFAARSIDARLRDLAALRPGLETRLDDEVCGGSSIHCFPNGLADLVRELARGPGVPAEPLTAEVECEGYRLRCALLWRPGELSGTHLFSWANTHPTRSGGTHVAAFNQALKQAFEAVADSKRVTAERVSTSLVAAIAIDVPRDEVQFAGATKERLANPEVTNLLAPGLRDALVVALNQDWESTQALIKHLLKPGKRA